VRNPAQESELKNYSSLLVKNIESNKLKIPKYLFHWTTAKKLEEMLSPASAVRPLKKMLPTYGVVMQWPDLPYVGSPALHVWSHPVGAMRFSPNDEYYAGKELEIPKLLMIEPDQDATVLFLKSVFKEPTHLEAEIDLGKVDFIFQQVYEKNGELRNQEWIILNSDKVKNYTSILENMPKEIRETLKKYAYGRYELPAKDKNTPKNIIGKYEKQRLGYFIRDSRILEKEKKNDCQVLVQKILEH
jgi:hypothetical protein